VAQPDPIVRKIAFRFRKDGPAAWHAHLDLVRTFERAVRRAGLPVRRTAGYHPHPRIVFPHALGVGIGSAHEWVEIEFARNIRPDEAARALGRALRPVLEVIEHRELEPLKKGLRALSADFRCSGFRDAGTLEEAAAAFRNATTVPVERTRKGKTQTIDLRGGVHGLATRGTELTFQVDLAEGRTPRPDEIVRWTAARSGDAPEDLDLVKTGMRLATAGGERIESTVRKSLAP
jgi:radical SAM-linked protein